MDFLFIFIAAWPAVIAARIAVKGEAGFKKLFLKSLGWFYGITFFNLMLLYVRGWGEYDFKFLSVQFLFKYMLSSMAAAAAGLLLRRVLDHAECRAELDNYINSTAACMKKIAVKALRIVQKNWSCQYYGKSAGILVSCSVSFLLCFFAPLDLFFNNRDEFWYDLDTLLPPVTIMSAAAAFVGILFMLLLFRLNKRVYQFVWIAGFVLFICSYIQGNYLTGNLPPLDGTEFRWEDYMAGRTESAILWCVVLAAAVILFLALPRKKFYRLAQWAAGGISAVLALALCMECFLTEGYRSKMNAVATTKDLFEMSENSNFVIFMLDALDAGVFQEVLQDNQEYREAFSDFTFYPDTMGAYPFTSRSVPFILSGDWYENDEPFTEYNENAYKNSGLFAQLEEKGWRLGVYETEMPLTDPSIYRFENVCGYDVGIKSYVEFAGSVLRLTGFKYAPFDIKQFCAVNMEEFNSNREDDKEEHQMFQADNRTFYSSIHREDMTYTDQNCFKFIHLEGAHVPFRYDKDVRLIEDGTYEQNVEASLTIAGAYLKKLKTCGVYDNSVIIILADHGYNWSEVDGRQNPLLMIKGTGEKHEMQVCRAPVSYEDLQEIYEKLLEGEAGDRISDWKEGDRRERRCLRHAYGEEDHLEEYMQEGEAADTDSMHPTGREFHQ